MRPHVHVLAVAVLAGVVAVSSALAGSGCDGAVHGRLNPRDQQAAAAARLLNGSAAKTASRNE